MGNVIKLYSRNKHRQGDASYGSHGFTIVELLIATSIFSVVLLVALNGFFQIGKLYYKGVASSQTQATAQKILDDMSSALQFASSTAITNLLDETTGLPAGVNSEGKPIEYICLGSTRYTYILGRQINLADWDTSNKFGLLRDSLSSPDGCGNPFDTVNPVALKNPKELLGSKMRLSNLCLMSVTGKNDDNAVSTCKPVPCTAGTAAAPCFNNLWLLNLKIAYGDDDILNSPSSSDPSCNSALSNSQYCSVANLQTVISRGYGN